MAIGDFYTQIILIALSSAGVLFAMERRCTDSIEKIEESLSQDWYIIQSHIWATDIKRMVEGFVSFIEHEISESESEDKYVELFSDKEKISSLRDMLDQLDTSYSDYLDFSDLFSRLVEGNEKMRRWFDRTIGISFALASWGVIGILIESWFTIVDSQTYIFWGFLCVLICLVVMFIYKISYYNRVCGTLRTRIRTEKSKYAHVIEKVA